jgi:hypothetical protein
MKLIKLSSLPHTWIIDVDGTIVKHNGHKNGTDEILPGVIEFWQSLPEEDTIILLTARKKIESYDFFCFLNKYGLRYNYAIFDLPVGERILINDNKPRGLHTAIAVNTNRNEGLSNIKVEIHNNI